MSSFVANNVVLNAAATPFTPSFETDAPYDMEQHLYDSPANIAHDNQVAVNFLTAHNAPAEFWEQAGYEDPRLSGPRVQAAHPGAVCLLDAMEREREDRIAKLEKRVDLMHLSSDISDTSVTGLIAPTPLASPQSSLRHRQDQGVPLPPSPPWSPAPVRQMVERSQKKKTRKSPMTRSGQRCRPSEKSWQLSSGISTFVLSSQLFPSRCLEFLDTVQPRTHLHRNSLGLDPLPPRRSPRGTPVHRIIPLPSRQVPDFRSRFPSPSSLRSTGPIVSSTSSTSVDFYSSLTSFFTSFPSMDRRNVFLSFAALRNAIPPSPTNPYTPLQLASVWLPEHFTQSPLLDLGSDGDFESLLYKKVANKTRPVATTLPENFRIVRHEHPDLLMNLLPLPSHPPDFIPTGRFTRERCDRMDIGKDLLWPEEIKLAEWIVAQHHAAFAWTDEERGAFDPQYFAPIEIPHISHVPWVLKQGPIPCGILQEVIRIIEDKWRSGVYEPSSSSYNSRWFCVFKKDGKSLRLVHSLEPLNAVTVRNAAMPPYTKIVAEDFAARSIYTTLTGDKGSNTQWVHAEHIVITVNK
ncbi:hypothetical protein BJ322DRAFT_1112375 [Thelephora terrestris]|uniref:Uncharacterized protein n=1 Tax=Thelephora terrestris TaxID=56493 RepID=A0A9P6L3R8_9AGAM|nr:hypothetical protein BJ322DRAFT_1112375 [Thelephora terrestris]